MKVDFTSLPEKDIAKALSRYDEDELREVVRWIDEQPDSVQERILPILDKEFTRRASRYYETKNGGEWI